MVVLLTCKNKEYTIKHEDTRVLTRLYVYRYSMVANSAVSGGNQLKFEHIQAFIVALVTCKNEVDPIKNEGAGVLTAFPPL